MKYKLKRIYSIFTIVLLMIVNMTNAQVYPGGVSSGVARGYKVDYYNGTFTAENQFGAGTPKAIPDRTGYSDKITGTEFFPVDNNNYAMEYTGILKIETAGSYSFQLAGDDKVWLYIDGNLAGSTTFSAGPITIPLTLEARDYDIKIKYYEVGNANSATLVFTAVPAMSGITAPANVDGRFVRYENAKLTAWYKASNAIGTATNVSGFTNMAPDYNGNGNLARTGTGTSINNATSLVNFNPGVRFDGDDHFAANNLQKGLSYRGGTKTMFMVNHYTTNVAQASTWMFFHGDLSDSQRIGFWKDGSNNRFSVHGGGSSLTSNYLAGEPKLLTGYMGKGVNETQNPLTLGINGTYNTPSNHVSSVDASTYGLYVANMNGANFPEAIYYPFELNQDQRQRVDTYLAVKYGITLPHDYLNTLSDPIFSLATNAPYTHRIFGIGREDAQGLYQKQSQSQMVSATGNDFLLLSKGSIATTNVGNNGTFTSDNTYLLVGDDNVSFDLISSDLPGGYVSAAGCTVNRINREWKAQVTGVPGEITVRAGSAGSFKFPASAAGLVLIVDVDGNGDFTNGAYRTYPAATLSNGVATFDNVTLNNGEVFTFAYTVVSPGGVSSGLSFWYNSAVGSYSDAAGTIVAVEGSGFGRWSNLAPGFTNADIMASDAGTKVYKANGINFNPAWSITNGRIYSQNVSGVGFSPDFTTDLSAFLAVTPRGSNAHRRMVLRRTDFNDDTNANSAILFNTNEYSTVPYATMYKDDEIRAKALTPYVTGQPTVFSLYLPNGSTPSLFQDGVLGTVEFATPLTALNGNQIIFGGGASSNGNGYSGAGNAELYSEAIIYNRVLTPTEKNRVDTYLSVKNGTTLNLLSSKYLASDGLNIYDYSTHANNIFGIGRDDCSGLLQKQSKSSAAGDNVTIGLASIVDTNSENTGVFSDNKSFVMVGNDNGALTGISTNIPTAYISCNPYRYERTWKVKNTGGVSAVQIKIGNVTDYIPGNWSNIALMIDGNGDGDFSDASLIYSSAFNNGIATFNNVTFPDGALFTLAYTLGFPGGVSNGLSFWYNAADGSFSDAAGTTLAVNGSAFGQWKNSVSVHNNSALQTSNGTVQYRTNGINYNPAWSITNGRIYTPFYTPSFTSSQVTSFLAVTPKGSSAHRRLVLRINGGTDDANTFSGILFNTNGSLGNEYSTFYRGGSIRAQSVPYQSGKPTVFSMNHNAGTSSNMYYNGLVGTSGVQAGLGAFSASQVLMAGGESGGPQGYSGAGNEELYGEAIIYNRVLPPLERKRVESYLAIKNGVTLDQSTPTTYVTSDDLLIWNYVIANLGVTNNFNKDITVIGRDDCGALNQKQSTSLDQDDIVAMGLGTISANNAENQNTFATNREFLTWAHNGGSLTNITNTGLPTTLTSGVTCYSRMERVWQTQTNANNGMTGMLNVEIGKQGLFSFSAANFNPVLLISESATDFTAATIVHPTSVSYGKAYFENVTFNDTADHVKYFTIAYIAAGPGGVRNNLKVWLNAEHEIYTDIEQTTPASAPGDKVLSLSNLITGGNFVKVEQPSATYQPDYIIDALSYVPAIYFTGGSDPKRLQTPNDVNSLDYRSANAITSIVTIRQDPITTPGYEVRVWDHNNTRMTRGYSKWSTNANVDRSTWVNKSELYTFTNSTTGNTKVFSNLKSLGSGTSTSTATEDHPFSIGGDVSSSFYTRMHFNMSELITYGDDKSLNADEFKRIHSYLALKYSYTLDKDGEIGGSYVASDGTTIVYDFGDYWNDITSIGRDDCSTLHKRQSIGIENLGGMVAISHDTTNGLAVNNNANPANFPENMQFLTFGDNGAALSWNGTLSIPFENQILMPLKRIWKVNNRNDVGAVYLQVEDNASTNPVKLPAASSNIYLIVSSSPDFTTDVSVVPMDLNGTHWSGVHKFTDGYYYTFAQVTFCMAPAGITDGLTAWYRSDNKAGGALANLNDESGNINLIKHGTDAATIVEDNLVNNNFNRYLQLLPGTTGGSSFATAAANQSSTALISSTAGTMYGVTFGTSKDRLFTVARSNNNTLSMTNNANSLVLNNVSVPTNYPAGVSNVSNIWEMNWNGTDVSAYTNGLLGNSQAYSTALVANSTHYVGIGGSYDGNTYTRSGIAFNEAFSYNRALSVSEQQGVNTYLALKFGQTLPHDYFLPSYNGANASTTTLYHKDAYGSRILGVGHHIAGCWVQNQSRSVLDGSLLSISIDGDILPENSRDASKWVDQNNNPLDLAYTIMGDNDGSLSWSNTPTTDLPSLYQGNFRYSCAQWLAREWKVTTTKEVPELFISFPDSTHDNLTIAKLPPVPVGYSVYMLINDTGDFGTGSNQIEIPMIWNATDKEWETNYKFAPGTKYITFAVRPATCGLKYIITNPATSTQQLKD